MKAMFPSSFVNYDPNNDPNTFHSRISACFHPIPQLVGITVNSKSTGSPDKSIK